MQGTVWTFWQCFDDSKTAYWMVSTVKAGAGGSSTSASYLVNEGDIPCKRLYYTTESSRDLETTVLTVHDPGHFVQLLVFKLVWLVISWAYGRDFSDDDTRYHDMYLEISRVFSAMTRYLAPITSY